MSEANKIYLLRGNDTPLSVCLRKREGDGDPVPYDLSTAERMRLALVGHGMHVFAVDIAISGEDDNIVSGVIPGRSLLKGDYDLEVTFTLDGRDKRFAIDNMFEAVDFLAEDADGETEGEGAGIWVNVTVQPEVIEIAGPTGPKGDTPVLTADEDGTIYADGVLLTEVVKDVTEAVESAERSRAAAESQRVAAESARVRAEQGRTIAETARETRAASDHATAQSDHATASADHTQAEADHTASETATQAATDAAELATEAAELATEAAETIDEKIEQKANKDGYYPEMSVGSLVGTEVTQVEGITAIAKSTGIAKINEVRGKILVWNQLIKNGDFSNGTTDWGVRYTPHTTLSIDRGMLKITRTGSYYSVGQKLGTPPVEGHKYLVSFYFEKDEGISISAILVNFVDAFSDGPGNSPLVISYSKDGYYSRIYNFPTARRKYLVICPDNAIDTSVYIDNFQLIDLTLMFGAGSEPSTVEEFEALFPLPYYDYNAGEIISNKTEKLDVTGFNQWDEEWEQGRINTSNGQNQASIKQVRSKNYIKVIANRQYFLWCADLQTEAANNVGLAFYDSEKSFIGLGDGNNSVFTIPSNCSFLRFWTSDTYGGTYKNDICLNISDPAKNGTYEPYKHADLPLNLQTITGKLNGEGESVTIFPDGMKSAGTVYDSLIVDEDGWCRRAVVRLTTHIFSGNEPVQVADWRHVDGYFAAGLKKSGLTGIKDFAGILMPDLPTITYGSIFNTTSPKEGIASYESPYSVFIRVLSSKASTSAELLAWLNGKTLIYELATPLEYVLDEPIYMCIKTEQGGVISQLPENGSEPTTAPMRMDITYALPPEALISGSSLENLLDALKTANKITNYTMTYNPTSGKWEFTIS